MGSMAWIGLKGHAHRHVLDSIGRDSESFVKHTRLSAKLGPVKLLGAGHLYGHCAES